METAQACLVGFAPPFSGDYVVARFASREQVHGDHGVLHAGPTLQEQDLVVCGHFEQGAQALQSFVVDVVVDFAAMAELHHAHATSFIVQEFIANLFEDFDRERARSGGEVVDAVVWRSGDRAHALF